MNADIPARRPGANSRREQVQHTNALLDDLVGNGEQRGRNRESERLRRL